MKKQKFSLHFQQFCIITLILFGQHLRAQPWTGGGVSVKNANGCDVKFAVSYFDVNLGATVAAPGSPFFVASGGALFVNFPSTAMWNAAYAGVSEIGWTLTTPNFADMSGNYFPSNCPAYIPCGTGVCAGNSLPGPNCLLTDQCCGCGDTNVWFDSGGWSFVYY